MTEVKTTEKNDEEQQQQRKINKICQYLESIPNSMSAT